MASRRRRRCRLEIHTNRQYICHRLNSNSFSNSSRNRGRRRTQDAVPRSKQKYDRRAGDEASKFLTLCLESRPSTRYSLLAKQCGQIEENEGA